MEISIISAAMFCFFVLFLVIKQLQLYAMKVTDICKHTGTVEPSEAVASVASTIAGAQSAPESATCTHIYIQSLVTVIHVLYTTTLALPQHTT